MSRAGTTNRGCAHPTQARAPALSTFSQIRGSLSHLPGTVVQWKTRPGAGVPGVNPSSIKPREALCTPLPPVGGENTTSYRETLRECTVLQYTRHTTRRRRASVVCSHPPRNPSAPPSLAFLAQNGHLTNNVK